MKRFKLVIVMAILSALNALADTHEKVQLWEGGPYWATMNLGANEPWEHGLSFWWGDTVGEHTLWSSWTMAPSLYKDIDTLRREGWITADNVLAPKHDAAHVQWGGRMAHANGQGARGPQ